MKPQINEVWLVCFPFSDLTKHFLIYNVATEHRKIWRVKYN
jgi:hypothetical protein